MSSFKVNKHVICDKQVRTLFFDPRQTDALQLQYDALPWSYAGHIDTDDHSELQAHLPGDKVLQFVYLLKVLWVFLHVLIIEEGLEKREKRYWS